MHKVQIVIVSVLTITVLVCAYRKAASSPNYASFFANGVHVRNAGAAVVADSQSGDRYNVGSFNAEPVVVAPNYMVLDSNPTLVENEQ